MNPLTKVKLINELNQREAQLGVKDSVSWHSVYKDSAWIFVGGLPYELTEGDIICVFSQYGEISNINLVRDKKTGKSKGFCFICYEDQRSTILAVDNFNGIKIKGRTIRVDHVQNYRPPKDSEDVDDVTKRLREEGCAPRMPSSSSSDSEEEYAVVVKKQKKGEQKKKKEKKKKKARKEKESRSQSLSSSPVRVKREREDPGYEKYIQQRAPEDQLPRAERTQERSYRDLHGDSQTKERDRERVRDDSNRGERRKGRERDEDSRRLWDSERTRREDRERNRARDREHSTKHGRDMEHKRS
ncbi:RNA-binding motif protein, X-linked 2 [Arapaima gigas]